MNPPLPPIAAVTGTTTDAGAELREVFSRCLTRAPGGAQLVVTLEGETILDVAGGGITEETPVQLFSLSKLVVAVAAAHAHAAGRLDLDAPLASYWEAFDRPETAAITARTVLAHSSGISAVARPLSTDELLAGELDAEVARQTPYWPAGTEHGYGAFTFGALMAGVFRHGVGTSVQDYAAEHVVAPSGGGFWFGAPSSDVLERLAPLTFDQPILTEGQATAMARGEAIADGAMLPIIQDAAAFFLDPRVQQADWPAMSGIGSARSISRIVNAALGLGARVLEGDSLERMIAEQSNGPDRMLADVSRFGSGVELPHASCPYLGGRSFGHQGAGGSVVAADPDSGLTLTYTSTHTASTVGASDQALVLLAAARQLVDA